MKPQIILASASIGRKGLLEKLGVPFEIVASSINEEKINDTDPYTRLVKRARAKAEDVVRKLSSQLIDGRSQSVNRSSQGADQSSQEKIAANYELRTANHQPPTANYLIIAADSEALLNGKTYGKSKNKAHAKEIVTSLMGETHDFLTATCIIHCSFLQRGGKQQELNRWENVTNTKVTLCKLTNQELTSYIARYDFTRFAAGYTLNETPWDLVTKIEGSYTNVIGLPFETVLPIFRQLHLL